MERNGEVEALGELVERVRSTRAQVRRLSDQSWQIVQRATKILSGAGADNAVTGNTVRVRIDMKSTLEVTRRQDAAQAARSVAFDDGDRVQTPGWIEATIEKRGEMRHIETIAIMDANERMRFEIVRCVAHEGDAEKLNERHIRGGVGRQSQRERDERWEGARREWHERVRRDATQGGAAGPSEEIGAQDEEREARKLADAWASALVRWETGGRARARSAAG